MLTLNNCALGALNVGADCLSGGIWKLAREQFDLSLDLFSKPRGYCQEG